MDENTERDQLDEVVDVAHTSEVSDRQYIELIGQELGHERELRRALEERVDELEDVVDELSDEILVKLDSIESQTSLLAEVADESRQRSSRPNRGSSREVQVPQGAPEGGDGRGE